MLIPWVKKIYAMLMPGEKYRYGDFYKEQKIKNGLIWIARINIRVHSKLSVKIPIILK